MAGTVIVAETICLIVKFCQVGSVFEARFSKLFGRFTFARPQYLHNKFLGKPVQHSQIGRAGQVNKNLLYAQGFLIADALTNRGGTVNQGGLVEFWSLEVPLEILQVEC
jgi:hypothetical protein